MSAWCLWRSVYPPTCPPRSLDRLSLWRFGGNRFSGAGGESDVKGILEVVWRASDHYYVTGAGGETEAVYTWNGSLRFWNIVAGGQLIGNIVPGPTRYYYLKDHLGSIRVTVKQDNTIAGWDDYYPFGMVMAGRSGNSGQADTKYKFTEKERDVETGQDWFEVRPYDSRIGIFRSVDPHSDRYLWSSPYVYAGNNPIAFVDPSGMDSVNAKEAQKPIGKEQNTAERNERKQNEQVQQNRIVVVGISGVATVFWGINGELGITVSVGDGQAVTFARLGAAVGANASIGLEISGQEGELSDLRVNNPSHGSNASEREVSVGAAGVNAVYAPGSIPLTDRSIGGGINLGAGAPVGVSFNFTNIGGISRAFNPSISDRSKFWRR